MDDEMMEIWYTGSYWNYPDTNEDFDNLFDVLEDTDYPF